jgi:ATP-grasp domain
VASLAKNILLTNTSWWACASRLAIGFTECGHQVSGVFPANGHPLAKTRALRQNFTYAALDPIGSLKSAIKTARPDIVIPCDDRAVEHLHMLHAQAVQSSEGEVAALIEHSLGNPAGYATASSRRALIALAAEGGIRVPATVPVESLDDLKKLNGFPWVLKADGTWGGHGVRMVHTPRQAVAAYGELAKPLGLTRFLKRWIVNRDPYWFQAWRQHTQPSIVAQAFVKGRPANIAAACWKGELLDAIAVEVVQAQGDTGSATVVRVVNSSEMLGAAKLLARSLGLTGFFGLDFMIEDETGEPYLIEMNPRCTPLSHLALGDGRDPIAALAARLSGQFTRARQPMTRDDRIAYFPQAWHWDPKSEFLNTSFCDIPAGEPELVQDLLQSPWPDRSLLAQLSNHLRGDTFRGRHSRGGLFQAALTAPEAAEQPPGEVACRPTHQ